MAPEDTGSNKASDDSSLAARRKALRGSLTKQAVPPDPYQPDPYLAAGSASATQQQTPVDPTAPFSYPSDDEFSQTGPDENGNGGATHQPTATQTSEALQAWDDPKPLAQDPRAAADAYRAAAAAAPAVVSPPAAEEESAKPVPTAGVMYEAWTQARGGPPEPPATADGGWGEIAAAIESTHVPPDAPLDPAQKANIEQLMVSTGELPTIRVIPPPVPVPEEFNWSPPGAVDLEAGFSSAASIDASIDSAAAETNTQAKENVFEPVPEAPPVRPGRSRLNNLIPPPQSLGEQSPSFVKRTAETPVAQPAQAQKEIDGPVPTVSPVAAAAQAAPMQSAASQFDLGSSVPEPPTLQPEPVPAPAPTPVVEAKVELPEPPIEQPFVPEPVAEVSVAMPEPVVQPAVVQPPVAEPEPAPQAAPPAPEPPATKKKAPLTAPASAAPAALTPATPLFHPDSASVMRSIVHTTETQNRQVLSMPALPVLDQKLQAQTVEVLNNIDQAMGACAVNLSTLQKIASEQTDALKALAETMQSQNFFEIGLNLNSVVESMSAALEPMKAVGELVPAIDQLVVALESREAGSARVEQPVRMTQDDLVVSLAEQLVAGGIDPWTFKCAFNTIYPGEDMADSLRRLGDLLGSQRLAQPQFRAAYDAVQGAEPPVPSATASASAPTPATITNTVVKVVQDELLLAELDELRKANEELERRANQPAPTQHDDVRLDEMQGIVQQLQSKLEQRELELQDIITSKDRELQEAQELLTSRWEEFNARYDELTETLHKRDDLLAEKEAELSRKDSENLQLKTQMEELRDQTKEMVAEMQKQFALATKPKDDQQKQQGFFDAPGQQNQQQLFEPAPARPLFQPNAQTPAPSQDQTQSGQMQQQGQIQQPQMQQAQTAQTPAMTPPNPTQAIPRPTATTPFLTGGSYGSGVRAQVFEVIVRQALAGAPWREICAGPMQVNNITPEEVEAEVKRRQALLGKK